MFLEYTFLIRKKRKFTKKKFKYKKYLRILIILLLAFLLYGISKILLKFNNMKNLNNIRNKTNSISNNINTINIIDGINDNKSSYEQKYFICFCIMGKKENLYAREIIEHHKKLGFDKFIIVDNNDLNSQKFSDVLQDYIDSGLVEIVDKIGKIINQGETYHFLYEKYNHKCQWLNFFDFDEFLVLHPQNGKNITIQEFLNHERYKKCDAVLVNWLMYSDNELLHYDNRTLFERFTQPEDNDQNKFVKSIVRGNLKEYLFGYKKSGHFPSLNIKLCDSSGNTNPNYRDVVIPPKYKYAQITHFSTKSTEEYVNKIKRGYPGGRFPEPSGNVDLYFFHNKFTKKKLKIFEDSFNMTFPKYHE